VAPSSSTRVDFYLGNLISSQRPKKSKKPKKAISSFQRSLVGKTLYLCNAKWLKRRPDMAEAGVKYKIKSLKLAEESVYGVNGFSKDRFTRITDWPWSIDKIKSGERICIGFACYYIIDRKPKNFSLRRGANGQVFRDVIGGFLGPVSPDCKAFR